MGFGEFRGRQLEVIRRVLAGRSTLAVLPTGEASVCKHNISCKSLHAMNGKPASIRWLVASDVLPTAQDTTWHENALF